jgi:long-chain acyl-CoA synthetase
MEVVGLMSNITLIPDSADFKTLNDIFESSTTKFANRTAFRIKRESGYYEEYTYARFHDMTVALAKYLDSLGVKKGKHVGLVSENRPEWPVIYFAILRTGATVVPMDALLPENEILHIAKSAGVYALFCSGPQFDKISDLSQLMRDLRKLIVLDRVPSNNRKIAILDDAIEAGRDIKKDKPALVKVKGSDLAALIYTSGTTGVSKGVMLTHKNITTNVLGLRRMISFKETDVFLSVLPLHHTFECTAGMIIPISKGSSITTAETLAAKRIVANIKETKVTFMMGVPLLYEKMATGIFRGISEKPLPLRIIVKSLLGVVKGVKKISGVNLGPKVFKSLRQKAGLDSLSTLISGGAPLPLWVAHAFENLGISFLNGYGLTETSPVLTVNMHADIDNSTVGYPVHGIELAIHEPDASGMGELKARGPFVMQGYYKNKKATQEVLRDGWLHTGDIARFDSKGRVIICGRCKNVIVTEGGKNVYPEEIEMALDTSIYVKESLVYGRPVSKNNPGEEVVACIVPDYESIEAQHGPRLERAAVEKLIAQEVATVNSSAPVYRKIKEFTLRDEEFLKTSTRKIKRHLYHSGNIKMQ